MGTVSKEVSREILEAMRQRYAVGSKSDKSRILVNTDRGTRFTRGQPDSARSVECGLHRWVRSGTGGGRRTLVPGGRLGQIETFPVLR